MTQIRVTQIRTIGPRRQSGVVLVLSMLLLVVITLLALSMFRSVGMQEMIAGSLREKDRALQSAISAQQYAEWWLTNGNDLNNVMACTAGLLNANTGSSHVCTNSLSSITAASGAAAFTSVPWTGAGGAEIGTVYTPPGLTATTTAPAMNTYWEAPRFYITLLGAAPAGDVVGQQGNTYQIDAWGYGGDPNTVVVVESTYLVTTGITPLG